MRPVCLYVQENGKNMGSTRERVLKCAEHFVLPGLSAPNADMYCTEANGKPFFKDSSIHFNVSHSGKYWICAMATFPVGIDVQQHIPGKNYERIANRFFTTEEIDYLLGRDYREFYKIWAAKESYVKYTGTGIADNFDKFSVTTKTQIKNTINKANIIFLDIDSEYSCALCAGREIEYEIYR